MSSGARPQETAQITETLKRAAAALRGAGIRFALAGSVAAWARGGPAPCNDLDFAIAERDAPAAEEALAAVGMRTEHPPEGWLLKAWDGDVLVDLIWDLEGLPDVDEVLDRAEEVSVHAVPMLVMSIDDVMVSRLCALDEHSLDLTGSLAVARALREQIDWRHVRDRTRDSPYAHGFLSMLEALDIITPATAPRAGEPRVRVVPGG